MSGSIEREIFYGELPAWLVRGVVCATPSGWLAVASEYRHIDEILGMIFGTLLWIVAVAGAVSHRRWREMKGQSDWTRALHEAVWVLAAWIAVGAMVGAGFSGLTGWWTWLAVPFCLPATAEMFAGLGSITAVARLGRSLGVPEAALADSFWWTTLTTLVQGGAIVAGLGLVALGLRGGRWIGARGRSRAMRD